MSNQGDFSLLRPKRLLELLLLVVLCGGCSLVSGRHTTQGIEIAPTNSTNIFNDNGGGGGARMRKAPMPLSARWSEDRQYYNGSYVVDEAFPLTGSDSADTSPETDRARRDLVDRETQQRREDNGDAIRRKRASGDGGEGARYRRPEYNKREADYTLDDSFWNEESPVGEVERLLKEYRQNQELVGRIGSHYYQIIYPVQLRHHEKMGISTREVNTAKSPSRGSGSNGNFETFSGARGRSRTGKHFHRTSLLIKAFNHKFRLDLELNTQLLAPNLIQKYYLPNGFQQDSQREIEHCYYHGTVKDYPGASAAFHTCNGVSGVIHIGNETFVIHPFYGGDLSKHPHIIFEARTKANKGCANSGSMEWRSQSRRPKRESQMDSMSSVLEDIWGSAGAVRFRRDVRETTKYIETAIVIDKAMFEKRNGSTRAEVIHDAIQVANIADLYFRTINTRVSVVYIETWQNKNQIPIEAGRDISRAISSFNDYVSRNLYKIDKDVSHLLTGEIFAGGEAGMATPETVCTQKAVGISVDLNVYEPHLLAGTLAHMIGHNIGMGHDDGREECVCRDWHGCIMSQKIVGLEDVQPYKFSECSKADYIDALRMGHGLCLLNKPNELELKRHCGNRIVEDNEECDCGSFEECQKLDPCCDPITCKLKKEAQCANGPCCNNCTLIAAGQLCRDSSNECDLPEFCTGESGLCPPDVYMKNGSPCSHDHATNEPTGYCFEGHCPTPTAQCEEVWGYGGTAADRQCSEQFNMKGSMSGHCGKEKHEYIKCLPENVLCGTLQCKNGERQPVKHGEEDLYSTTIISIKGTEYECKWTSGTTEPADLPPHGLVRDGTPCGDNLICINQTCTSLFPHIDQTKCPSNTNTKDCSGHGFCTNMNKCFCDMGWGGTDCSLAIQVTTHSATQMPPSSNTTLSMKRNEVIYENYHGSNTVFLVGILLSIVGFVFVTFTLMALCYRSMVVNENLWMCLRRKNPVRKYDPPYIKKPMAKHGGSVNANHRSVEEVSLDGSNKLITYGNQASFRGEHKMQLRRGTGSGSEEDPTHNEKGILKKHQYGYIMADNMSGIVNKDKWGDDNRSENMELIAQQQQQMHTDSLSQSTLQLQQLQQQVGVASDVERTLKSLNGYHEDILEALRNAASHRGTGAGNTPSGSGSISEELLRKTLQDCNPNSHLYNDYLSNKRSSSKASSKENICDTSLQSHTVMIETNPPNQMLGHHHRAGVVGGPPMSDMNDDEGPSVGPLRIRNLEDLIRQLEHHSSRHMSPSGSEDIRMSENEAERHFRIDSSAACSESSQGSTQHLAQKGINMNTFSGGGRCRPRSDDESRFVYGRYRHPPPPNRHPAHSPHSFHSHHSHSHGHGAHSSHHSSHTHLHQDEDDLYESADRTVIDNRHDTPDSESDDFIQAQQQLARWASEDVVSVVVLDQQQQQQQHQPQQPMIVGGGAVAPQQGLVTIDSCSTAMAPQMHSMNGVVCVTSSNGLPGIMGPLVTSSNHQQQQQHHHNNLLTGTGSTSAGPLLIATGATNGGLGNICDYYPSPTSTTTETESSGSVIPPCRSQAQLLPMRRSIHLLDGQSDHSSSNAASPHPPSESSGRYPEYKH